MTSGGRGWEGLLALVPVIKWREKKDGRHAGQSASDKENAVGMNEAVRGAQAFDLSARKPLQNLSQPGIGRTQQRILRGGVSNVGETRHVCYKRTACKANAEAITSHDQIEKSGCRACERQTR